MSTSRQLFTTQLHLEVGETVTVTVGYQFYGRLNPMRDNVILLCHPFMESGHAAGPHPQEPSRVGWWDPLVGPGKAFDTDYYFVLSMDSLCNLNLNDPNVVTTGPSSPSPHSGESYGMDFPQVTVRDQVRLQQRLIESLGIEWLQCVAGPSTGGFMALEWAVTFPTMVRQVVAVATAHLAPPIFAMAICQAALDAIRVDPVAGVLQATQLFLTLSRSHDWLAAIWGRRTAEGSVHPWAAREGRYALQVGLVEEARQLASRFDPAHFAATARMAILHDIAHGNRDLDVAVQKIKAELLLMPITGDLLFPPELSESLAALIRAHGGQVEVAPLDSLVGHQAAWLEAHRLGERIKAFLGRPVLH